MTESASQTLSGAVTDRKAEIIRRLGEAIAGGQHWYHAALEAIGAWDTAEEVYDDRTYSYLVGGEAFDWLLLAERLLEAVSDLVPEEERLELLFHGKPPVEITTEEFKEFIGNAKYCQYLNYFYGITVEEALLLAVEEEVRKERWAAGYSRDRDIVNEAFRRIYEASRTSLLKQFRGQQENADPKSIALGELKEFTYWLFKYRFKKCDKAKVASDTKKGLCWLEKNSSLPLPDRPPQEVECGQLPPPTT